MRFIRMVASHAHAFAWASVVDVWFALLCQKPHNICTDIRIGTVVVVMHGGVVWFGCRSGVAGIIPVAFWSSYRGLLALLVMVNTGVGHA